MGRFAWVTLATNDSYSLGALVVASSLKRVHTAHELVVLVTPGVTDAMRSKLASVFNLVQEVNVLDSQDAAHLALLKRPELGITFTKLHCWRLTQYEKCVFLDADTLIIQNSDELFEREELSAAPDVGWPDCFNSGVFVYRPSLDTFGKLVEFATTTGSFDGGDQGLLNQYFHDWATKDIANRLPFIYNTTTTAVYSYIPAFKQFGDNLKILHFIGNVKPWLLNFDPQSKTVHPPAGYQHLSTFLQFWWTIFCDDVHPNLSPDMNKMRSSYGSTETNQPYNSVEFLYVPPSFELLPNPKPNNTEKDISYYDPWESYDNHNNRNDDIPCNMDNNQYIPENQNNYNNNNINNNNNYNNNKTNKPPSSYETIHNNNNNNNDNFEVAYLTDQVQVIPPIDNNEQNTNKIFDNLIFSPSNVSQIQHPPSAQILPNDEISFETVTNNNNKIHNENNFLAHGNDINVNEITSNHAKEVSDDDTLLPVNHEDDNNNNNSSANESGIAGALAKLTLGVNRSSEQEEFENHMRRQCWESGNIDYLGKDSFDNIWRRITQTIESGTKQDLTGITGDKAAAAAEPAAATAASQPKSTSLPDEKLKVDIPKQVTVSGVGDEELNPNERNVIAVCSPHELMRSLSSPGLAQEQIITTVLPNGKTVQQKILTFPEREIEIEDYERIEILGPITRKITTETTRIIAGKQSHTEVVVRTEIHPQDTETKAIIEKQQTVSQNTQTNTSQPEPQPIDTNQNQTVAIKPKTPKISITDVLKPLPGDKVEFDSINNITTITRNTATGYEMIIATVTPDGRDRVQTKTFFNPVEIRSSEEIHEEYTEERTIHEGTTKTTTTSNTSTSAVKSAITDNTVTNTTEGTTTVANVKPSVKVETREVVVEGRKGVEKTVTETTVEGKIIIKKTIVYEGVEEEEIIEETETHTQEGDKTVVSKVSNPVQSQPISQTNVTNTTDTSKTTNETTEQTISTTVVSETTSEKGEKIVVIIEKFSTGYREITTITTPDGLTRSETKTFYDPVEVPCDEKDTEHKTTKTTTDTTEETISTTVVSETTSEKGEKIVVTIEKFSNGHREITTITTPDGLTRSETKTFYDPVEVPCDEKDTEHKTTKTTTDTTEETISTTVVSETTSEKGEKIVVTIEKFSNGHREITTITTPAGLTSSKTKTFYDPVEVPCDKTVTDHKTIKTTTDTTEETISTTVVSETTSEKGEKIVVTIEKFSNGHREITTITTPDGLTRSETKTFYDPVEVPCDEKVTEHKTTKTTTDTTEETISTTVVSETTSEKGEKIVVTIEKFSNGHREITTITTPDGLTRSETKTFYDPVEVPCDEEEIVEIEETTTTTEPVVTTKTTTTTSTVPTAPVKPTSDTQTTIATTDSNTENTVINEQTVTTTVSGVTTNVETTAETTVTSTEVTGAPQLPPPSETTTTTTTVVPVESTTTENTTITTQIVPGEEKRTVVIEKTETGHKEITTITTADGLTRVETKTVYDPVEEEIIEETEETTTTTEPVITKTTTTTSTVPVTPVNPPSDTQTTITTTDNNLKTTDVNEKNVTTTVTGVTSNVEITEETTVISTDATSKPETGAPQLPAPLESTTTTTVVPAEPTNTENTTTQIVPAEEKRTVVIEKTETGHKEITTITTADGLTRVETKTFYDPVEEEIIEETEETTTTTEPVVTKTTTTTSSTPTSKPIDPSTTVATVDEKTNTQLKTEETVEETKITTTTTSGVATNEEIVEETKTVTSTETPAAITVLTKKPDENTVSSVEITEETITTENIKTNSKPVTEKTTTTIDMVAPQPIKPVDTPKTIAEIKPKEQITSNITAVGQVTIESRTSHETTETYEETHTREPAVTTKTIINTTTAPTTEKPKPPQPKGTPDATKPKSVTNKKTDATKTNTNNTEITSTTTKSQNLVAKTTSVAEEKTSVVIEKTATGHKEITTIVSADGETRVRTKTFYDPVEQEEEEIEEYEETHTTEPVVKTIKKTPVKGAAALTETASNQKKTVTEIETTTETTNVKTPQKLEKKKTTAVQKVDKLAGAVTTSVIGQETITTKTKTTATDISRTVQQQKSDKSTTAITEKTKTIKDSKTATDTAKKSVASNTTTGKTKSTTTNQTQQAAPKGEPQQIVTTRRIENGTEHTITTIFPDGTKKIETKTFFDAVEVSGDEEEYEEYEEIEEEEPVDDKKQTKQPAKPTAAPVPAPAEPVARKKIVPPVAEPKPTKEDSQFQPSKLKIPAAFAAANAAQSGPVRPVLRKAAPKTPAAGAAAGTTAANNGTPAAKDAPVPPPRKKEVGKLFKTSMLLLLLISLALIYNQCVKRNS